MPEIGPITDEYIDSVIKSAGATDPNLYKTQGAEMRELVKLLRDRLEQEVSTNNDGYLYQTYTELRAAMAAGNLVPGRKYVLTDYNTQYIQPVTNTVKTDAAIERLVFTALTNTTFCKEVKSLDFPGDLLEFDFNNNVLVDGTPGTYGVSFSQTEMIPGAVNAYVAFISLNNLITANIVKRDDVLPEQITHISLSNSSIKVVVCTTDQIYSGTGFNILINGVAYEVRADQIIFFDDDVVNNSTVIAEISGNCKAQVYQTVVPDYVPLPDTSAGIPDTLRNGWINRRIDDQQNDTPFDHRTVLTWAEITPGKVGYYTFQIDTLMPNTTADYKAAKICLGHFISSDYNPEYQQYPYVYSQSNTLYGQFYANYQLLNGGYAVYAIGKCLVESYCLINGIQYTIPPFDNKESDIDIQGVSALIPIVQVPKGNVYIQIFPDPTNVPEYIPLTDFSTSSDAVLGEKSIFGAGCTRNFIQNLPNGQIPQIAFGNNCTDNKCLGQSDNINLTDGCSFNTFQDSGISVLADLNGEPGSVYNEFYTNTFATVLYGSYNVFNIIRMDFLSGSNNKGYHSDTCVVNGNFNTLYYSDSAYIDGSYNNMGQTLSTGLTNGFIWGSGNIMPFYTNQRFIRGSGNIFKNTHGASDFLTIIGDNNEINGYFSYNIFGNRNIFFYLLDEAVNGIIFGDENYFGSQCGKITSGRNFNFNRLENVHNVIYGNDCTDNYEIDVSNVSKGDNYSGHKPWTD